MKYILKAKLNLTIENCQNSLYEISNYIRQMLNNLTVETFEKGGKEVETNISATLRRAQLALALGAVSPLLSLSLCSSALLEDQLGLGRLDGLLGLEVGQPPAVEAGGGAALGEQNGGLGGGVGGEAGPATGGLRMLTRGTFLSELMAFVMNFTTIE